MGNFILRFCACPILMALLNQISFETKQKSKCKVEFNLIFISIEKKYFGNIQFFWRKSGTSQNFIAHVTYHLI